MPISSQIHTAVVAISCLAAIVATTSAAGPVEVLRTPHGGIQPQCAVDADGTLHLVYFAGNPANGDAFYVKREAGAKEFSSPLRVNSQPGSVIAVGTIRGAQMALGNKGRVHVCWNGSGTAEPKGPTGQNPMLYARLTDDGSAFEEQRNLIASAYGLDGGGSVAADRQGHVYVAWHGMGDSKGEVNRRVYVARSSDEGRTFAAEEPAAAVQTGACGCCGMKAFADPKGRLYMLYRSARSGGANRDMELLVSQDAGKTFDLRPLDKWMIAQCPMSSETFASGPKGVVAAWENAGQIKLLALGDKPSKAARPFSPPGAAAGRKHPSVAINNKGELLVVWTEGTGWERGGTLAWQVYSSANKPTKDKGRAEGVPVWGLPTAAATPEGGFVIIY